MTAENTVADRLLELECRIAYQDETIDTLNDVVREQWADIDRMRQKLERLEQRIAEVEERQGDEPIAKPPHY